MESWEDRINIDPKILGGMPVIQGTRVPVYVLVGAIAGGDSVETLCEEYAVTKEDVRAALMFAAELSAKKRRSVAVSRR